MKVLGIDCAGSACAAGVVAEGRIVASRSEAMAQGQAEALVPMIDAVLTEARLEVGALDLIAVTVGPGSFTGLRTGLATARGLALASGKPLIGVTSFAAVADAVSTEVGERPLVVALESKRAELYLQRFDRAGAGAPALLPASLWPSVVPAEYFVIAGDGAARFAAGLSGEGFLIAERYAHSNAVAAARLAPGLWKSGAAPPIPLYLRAPDVTLPPLRAKPAP